MENEFKLSPYVQPFVPRTYQEDKTSVHDGHSVYDDGDPANERCDGNPILCQARIPNCAYYLSGRDPPGLYYPDCFAPHPWPTSDSLGSAPSFLSPHPTFPAPSHHLEILRRSSRRATPARRGFSERSWTPERLETGQSASNWLFNENKLKHESNINAKPGTKSNTAKPFKVDPRLNTEKELKSNFRTNRKKVDVASINCSENACGFVLRNAKACVANKSTHDAVDFTGADISVESPLKVGLQTMEKQQKDRNRADSKMYWQKSERLGSARRSDGVCTKKLSLKTLGDGGNSMDDPFEDDIRKHQSASPVSSSSKKIASDTEIIRSQRVKKKKTDGQRKKEYKNKLKSLPSVQGKILTVTHEFYNLMTQNEPRMPTLLTNATRKEEVRFQLCDFPALGEDCDSLTTSFAAACSIQENERDMGLQSDSDWSDVEVYERSPSTCGHFRKKGMSSRSRAGLSITKENCDTSEKDFPTLGGTSSMDKPKSFSYSASVKMGNSFGIFSPLEDKSHPVDEVSSGPLQSGTMKRQPNLSANLKLERKPSNKPKAKSLIQLNLGNMLIVKKNAIRESQKKNVSLSELRKMVKVKPLVANILDSSAPSRRRGKEREKPIIKKPTAMKKIILKEREERKLTRVTAMQLKTGENLLQSENSYNENFATRNALEKQLAKSVKLEASDAECNVPAEGPSKHTIHGRKFREYCNHMLNPDIDQTVTTLIQDLIRFQDRLYQKDPIKAKMRRRMVVGLREVTKHLKLKKLKCVILAPNLETIKSNGGLDEVMNAIITLAQEQSVPFVFALGRRGLGRVCLKKVPVSSVGIFNYEGSEANFKHLCELAIAARDAYNEAVDRGTGIDADRIEGLEGKVDCDSIKILCL